jgi:hypothetical protein
MINNIITFTGLENRDEEDILLFGWNPSAQSLTKEGEISSYRHTG